MRREKSLWKDNRGEFQYIGVGVFALIVIVLFAWFALKASAKRAQTAFKRS